MPAASQQESAQHRRDAPRTGVAVVASRVGKEFRKPHHRVSTLKERVLHPLRRVGHDRFHALEDVSFEVAEGEFFGIVGRNGSGKSTLLKCLAGIYRPDHGEVLVGGAISPFLELGVGFNPDLDAYDNVIVNGTLMGLPRREAQRRFDEIIAFAELEEFVDVKLKNYSSGMHVRLAFSVAIRMEAPILLIDEVLAVGDAAFQMKCMDAFRDLKRAGRTILFVTHDMGAVQAFCDRAMLLEHGRALMIDRPSRVASAYNEICFTEQRGRELAAGAEERTGTGLAEVVDGWLEDSRGSRVDTVRQGERCRFVTEVAFHGRLENPGIGFQIHDAERRLVLVTDSQFQTSDGGLMSEPLGVVEPGTRLRVSFEFDVILTMGTYSVSSNVHPEGGPPVADERKWFRSFGVTAHMPTPGVVDLPIRVGIERTAAAARVTVEREG